MRVGCTRSQSLWGLKPVAIRVSLAIGLLPSGTDDFGILQPHLNEMAQKRGDVVIEPDAPIEHVHFPECGIASIVATSDDGRRLEVGLYTGTPHT